MKKIIDIKRFSNNLSNKICKKSNLKHGHILDIVSECLGYKNYNTLKSLIYNKKEVNHSVEENNNNKNNHEEIIKLFSTILKDDNKYPCENYHKAIIYKIFISSIKYLYQNNIILDSSNLYREFTNFLCIKNISDIYLKEDNKHINNIIDAFYGLSNKKEKKKNILSSYSKVTENRFSYYHYIIINIIYRIRNEL